MQSHRAQVNGNNILTSTAAERQSQKQQTPQSHPHKQEAKASGKSVQSVVNLASYPIKNLQGQNFTIPVQPVNFSFKPCVTSDIVGGNSKQQQALNGGVEVIPSQAFAVSFASFNETNLPSNLNFSSMKQNLVKTYSTTVEKRGGNSSHQDDDKKNHSCNTSRSQQSSQLLQKQHGMQQQQPTTAIRNKASSTNTASAIKFANNGPVFSQSHTQFKSSNQTSHSKITGRTMGSHVNHSSSITSKTATAKNISQEKGRRSHGTPFDGGHLKPNSEGWKVNPSVNTSQLQQTENSSVGSSQKSSPVCGRNVPSILSSSQQSHLSALKFLKINTLSSLIQNSRHREKSGSDSHGICDKMDVGDHLVKSSIEGIISSVFDTLNPENSSCSNRYERGKCNVDHAQTLSYFNFSTVEDPCKVYIDNLPTNPICLSTSSYPLDSCASTHGNQNNKYEEIGHRNEDGLVDVSKYCFDASLDVVDHKKYVSTDASGGSSWERLLGSFRKTVNCDATQKQNLLSTFEMPLDIIIGKCLIQEIMVQYNYVSKLIINVLEEAFKLQEHLLALRRYHFMESAD
ncbi:hypothetical protein KIW84_030493 [Lathyrus oleraceus]|uniref:Uncharacterized protein n=1 Tax=Pisum sativum TaxID=3888 RepID=A0A9D4XNJ3_PEA|nr:hypothetical protein KIW84_030493 [Pisum sativum]